MRVTALGHAGLQVETRRATMLVDPWFSPEGAFQAAWFQYPDNAHMLPRISVEPDAIVISHEHLDHVDTWFLAGIPSRVPVIVHRYPLRALRRKIMMGGDREIIEVPAWERVEIAEGTRVFFVPEDSPMNHDAAIVIEGDGDALLDVNDARLSPVQYRSIRAKVGGIIHLLALQAAGASWYPICYASYNPERRRELARRKRLAKFGYVHRAARIVEPVAVAPFAGPPCFLDPDLFRHNAEIEDGIFPDQEQAATWLRLRGIANVTVLLPGDTWETAEARGDEDPAWADFSFAAPWDYLRDYAARRRAALDRVIARYPEPTTSLWEPFRDYFRRLLTLSPYFNQKINMRVGFEIIGRGGGAWAVDFRSGSVGVYDTLGECAYGYRFASRWLAPIVAGTVPWEDFFLSLRFQAWRQPDVYNDHLLGLLKFAHPEALEAVEAFEATPPSDEQITVHAEGRTYRVQRQCPHASNDLLETGEVLPGRIIRCLAHHYEFDLETGACLNGTCPTLTTRRIN